MTYISQEPKFAPGTKCAVPGCDREAIDLDHAIFGGAQRDPNKQTVAWRKFLDSEYNLQPACEKCNRLERKTNRHHVKFARVSYWMEKDPEGFKEWLHSYPGSLVEGSAWYLINIMVDAIESVKTEKEFAK